MPSDREIVARTVYFVKASGGAKKPQIVREWQNVELARAYVRAMRRAGKTTVKLTVMPRA